MRPLTLFPVALLALAVPPGSRAASATLEEIAACAAGNLPEAGQIKSVSLRVRDRTGSERNTRAAVYSRRDAEGLQRVLVRLESPPDLVGAAFLRLESESGPNDLIVRIPGVEGVKYLRGMDAAKPMFGSDFSYEDFERLQGLVRPGETTLQPDSEIDGRAVWVVETDPDDATVSAYDRIVTAIDQETCVVLESKLYESGGRLRKILSSDPTQVKKLGSAWVAQRVDMEDLRDGSSTRLTVESVQRAVQIPPTRFSVEELSSWKPEGSVDPIAIEPEEADVGAPALGAPALAPPQQP